MKRDMRWESSCRQTKHLNDEKLNYLCSADHFVLNQCDEIQPVHHSIVRHNRMNELLSSGKITTPDEAKTLLSERYPNGLECPYYKDGSGTLYHLIRGVIYRHKKWILNN